MDHPLLETIAALLSTRRWMTSWRACPSSTSSCASWSSLSWQSPEIQVRKNSKKLARFIQKLVFVLSTLLAIRYESLYRSIRSKHLKSWLVSYLKTKYFYLSEQPSFFLLKCQKIANLLAGQEDRVVVPGDDVDEVLGSNTTHVRNEKRTAKQNCQKIWF